MLHARTNIGKKTTVNINFLNISHILNFLEKQTHETRTIYYTYSTYISEISIDMNRECARFTRSIMYDYTPDINECARGADQCDNIATCTNTIGSYQCACPTGTMGNGFTCTGKLDFW